MGGRGYNMDGKGEEKGGRGKGMKSKERGEERKMGRWESKEKVEDMVQKFKRKVVILKKGRNWK